MSAVLDRIRGEIRDRLRASAAAVREYERLEAALAALGSAEATAGRNAMRERSPAAAGAQPSTQRGVSRCQSGA
jgi:hypothetical protein